MATIPEALALAQQFVQSGQLPQAEEVCRRVLQVAPTNTDAWWLHGYVCQTMGKLDDAAASYRQVLRIKPDMAEVHNNLGNTLIAQGKRDEAVPCFHRALLIKPSYAAAHYNLANAFREQGQLTEAAASFRRALQLRPDYADAYHGLGAVLAGQGRLDEAKDSYRQALRLKPDHAEALNGLGVALVAQGKFDEASACLREALRIQPGSAEAHNNLGNTLVDLGRVEEALTCFRQALHLKPDFPDARKNMGMAWLVMGDFGRGWPEYEWRWQCREQRLPTFHRPFWDGGPLEGRTILLYAEQGLGDTLQFIRYAQLLKQRGGNTLVACQEPLVRLIATCPGVDHVVASKGAAFPPFDVVTPLLSLPGKVGTTLQNIPTTIPYLFPDPALVEHWRRELDGLGFKVGIAWQGSPTHQNDRFRSFPLAQFAPLSRIPGVRLFSLQKGVGSEQVTEAGGRFALTDLGVRTSADFMDTAAVAKNLDLVISADTSVVHLAGALGVPVWVALPMASDWRWLLGREDSPWYPTARLFRQKTLGDWNPVFERIGAALESAIAQGIRRAGGVSPLRESLGTPLRGMTPPARPLVSEIVAAGIPQALALAWQHQQAGRLTEAEQIYRQILAVDPAHADALWLLGYVCHTLHKREEAVGYYQQALRSRPDLAAVHLNLGIVLLEQGDLKEAEARLREALRLNPQMPEGHNSLGNALREQGKLDEAEAALRRTIELKPDFVFAYHNLGNVLRDQGNLEEAVTCYRQAIRLKPDYAEAFNGLGNALQNLRQLDEAVRCYQQALRLKPDHEEAMNGLGAAWAILGKPDEAAACFQAVLRHSPNDAKAHRNLAMAYLVKGDYQRGWPEYEWRWRCPGVPSPGFRQPAWDGSPLTGRVLLLHGEQGFGDMLQFVRYAALLKARGASIVLQCPDPLVRLLNTCPGADVVVGKSEPLPRFDVHAALMSLPGMLLATMATPPANVPYVFADPSLVKHWRQELSAHQGLKVGICWQGNPKHQDDRHRSVPLIQFAPLAHIEGVRLFSLQKGHGSEQRTSAARPFDLTDLGELTSADFMETAAVIKNLDLVVTVDTAMAHLAGALGVPVWVALPFAPDWRWLLAREDCPWYPTMRLFRQTAPGDWNPVFERMAVALTSLNARRSRE